MVTNGGYRLYMPKYNDTEENYSRLVSSMDGMMIESVFYGYEAQVNRKTPRKVSREMQQAIKAAQDRGLPTFNIEYCNERGKKEKAARKSSALQSVWYDAFDVELSKIPKLEKNRVNEDDCWNLEQVDNFLTVLNPDYYKSKQAYLMALQETDYDLIFVDLEFRGKPLTRKDVDSLRIKADGGRRMICAYMSVGEAENYRSYWEEGWNDNPPPWICDANTEWEGNYKVMYWTKPWRDILFGRKDSYLDKILAAGFDGVFLDVIDAYDYFEEEYKP
jgi:cysteinyl-tRNA synthetase